MILLSTAEIEKAWLVPVGRLDWMASDDLTPHSSPLRNSLIASQFAYILLSFVCPGCRNSSS